MHDEQRALAATWNSNAWTCAPCGRACRYARPGCRSPSCVVHDGRRCCRCPRSAPLPRAGSTVAAAAAAPRVVRSAPCIASRSCDRIERRRRARRHAARPARRVAASVPWPSPSTTSIRAVRPLACTAHASPRRPRRAWQRIRRRLDDAGARRRSPRPTPRTRTTVPRPWLRVDVEARRRAATWRPGRCPGVPAVECPSRRLAATFGMPGPAVERDHLDADRCRPLRARRSSISPPVRVLDQIGRRSR